MTRPFRLEEDERRYFALRSEFFIRLVQSGVPTQTVHDILRNFGKLEDTMFFEGVRQGMAVSLLADADQQGWDAVTAHATTYGDAATPLTRVEESDPEYPTFHTHPWLSKDPMRFGPLTLTEAHEQLGPDLGVKGAPARNAPARPRDPLPTPFDPATSPGMTDLMTDLDEPLPGRNGWEAQARADRDSFDPMVALERLANGEDPDVVLGRPADVDASAGAELQDLVELPDVDPFECPPGEDHRGEPIHRPALLDNVRDILLRLAEPPKDWQTMILMLMRETRHDAGFLDDMMSTPMGMTVISQAKLFHLHPGAMPEIKPVAAYPAVGYGPDPNTSR